MPRSPFLEALSRHMLAHHYGRRTVDSYLYWIRFFIRFHNKSHPRDMGATEVKAFLTFLANDRRVSVSTQKICLNALAYLYNKYLQKNLGDLGAFNKATRPRKLPVVLHSGASIPMLSFATHLLESGADIRTVQEQLGHSDVHWATRLPHSGGLPGLRIVIAQPSREDHGDLHTCAQKRRPWCAQPIQRSAKYRAYWIVGC